MKTIYNNKESYKKALEVPLSKKITLKIKLIRKLIKKKICFLLMIFLQMISFIILGDFVGLINIKC